jgi:hypothetical protein
MRAPALFPRIIQEFRRWFRASHEQVIPCPSAGDVKQMPFGVIMTRRGPMAAGLFCHERAADWGARLTVLLFPA